ncbi:MAG TPA: GPR endopeptidase [Bacilli bacterium]|nr:GPR endopeptidase [Bacilli bacterium]HOR96671.1 GPR endopeptidase [Bacilli bacterium]
MEQATELNYTLRTDLAHEDVSRRKPEELPDVQKEELDIGGVRVQKTVIGETAAEKLKKRPGTYFLLELEPGDYHDSKTCRKIELALSEVLEHMLKNLNLKGKRVLVVGLGNVNVTPDSLGPYVLDNIIVTRHLFELGTVSEGYTEVCGMSPGVMGTTGIETYDIISAVHGQVDVDFLIVIDALAAASLARVNRSIQVTDAGISPGSGVGNKRKEISSQTMGVPVIAIGVPTVVDAVTITSDTIDFLLKYLNQEAFGEKRPAEMLAAEPLKRNFAEMELPKEDLREQWMGKIGLLTEPEKRSLIKEVLSPQGYNMMVTPKEVDADVEDLAKLIATSIDITLHDSYRNTYLSEKHI